MGRGVKNRKESLQSAIIRIEKVRAQRDALLEALTMAVRQNQHDMLLTSEELRACESAIAKATQA